jgi:hypothetical protein
MESELRKLGRNLDEFVAKTHRAQAAARVKYAGELRLLRARQQQAKKVLARMRRRGTAAGDPLKAGVRKAWSDLTAAVREASKRYRETS